METNSLIRMHWIKSIFQETYTKTINIVDKTFLDDETIKKL